MSVEAGVVAYLLSQVSVTNLLASTSELTPLTLRQGGSFPALVYARISGPRVHAHSGAVGGDGVSYPRLQLTAWAQTYSAAVALGDAVRKVLDGFAGTMGSYTVQSCLIQNDLDLRDPETGLYGRLQDYIIWHVET